MGLSQIVYDLTGSKNPSMTAFKPEVTVSKLVEKIGMKVQRYIHVFEVQLPNETITHVVRPNRKWEIQNSGIRNGSTYYIILQTR